MIHTSSVAVQITLQKYGKSLQSSLYFKLYYPFQCKHHTRRRTAFPINNRSPFLHLHKQIFPREILFPKRWIHPLHMLLRRLPSCLLRKLPHPLTLITQLYLTGIVSYFTCLWNRIKCFYYKGILFFSFWEIISFII